MRCEVPGAHDQDRTGDLVLTKDALCRLSYVGLDKILERETGLEPATNSLEGYDSAN